MPFWAGEFERFSIHFIMKEYNVTLFDIHPGSVIIPEMSVFKLKRIFKAKSYIQQQHGKLAVLMIGADELQESRGHPTTQPEPEKRRRLPRYKCRYCDHRAPGKADVAKHERVHTRERPYICHVCGEGYLQSSHLHDHQRVHSGIKPFACDVCLRGFSKKSDMQRHRRIHTGELPYSCNFCGKAFRQTTQCSNHIKKHHSASTEPPLGLPEDQSSGQESITEEETHKLSADYLFNMLTRDGSDLLLDNIYDGDVMFDPQYFDETHLLSSSAPFLC